MQADFIQRGWDPQDLKTFRMELEGEGAGTPAAAPIPAETAPASTPSAPATPAADPFDSGAESFPRSYVEKLRQEAADRRTAVKPYEEAFSAYGAEERDVWLQIAKLTAEDPATAKGIMEDLFKSMLDEPEPEIPSAEDDKPLTRKEMQDFLAAQESAKQEAAAVSAVEKEAESLGYKQGDWNYFALLKRAMTDHNGDLQEAHKAFEADKQKIIDEYVSGKQASGDKFAPGMAGGSAPADPSGGAPKTFEQAKASAKARMLAAGIR
jgi:hypothetical protein